MISHQQALADHDLMGSVALAVMVDLHGADVLEWEPETVEMEIRSMGVHPPVTVLNRLNAAVSILASDMFHRDFLSWNLICEGLYSGHPDPDKFVPVDLDAASWGCLEAVLIEGPDEFDSQEFAYDIRVHAGRLLANEGLYTPPPYLAFARLDEGEVERTSQMAGADPVLFAAKSERDAEHMAELDMMLTARMRLLKRQLASIQFHSAAPDFLKGLR